MENQIYGTQGELLPSFRRVPPPEVLRSQMRQTWDEYSEPALDYARLQLLQNLGMHAVFGNGLGHFALQGANNALMKPPVQAGIAGLAATRFGAPLVMGVTNFARSPTGQKFRNVAEKAIDWIF